MTAFPYPFTLAQPVAGGFAAFTYRGPENRAQVSATFADLAPAIEAADRIDSVGARVLCPAAGQSAAYDADQDAARQAMQFDDENDNHTNEEN